MRSNPEIAIYLDQRPSKTIKKMKSSFYTHLTGVLRDSSDQNPVPKSTPLHKVRADALTSWIVSMNEGFSFNIDDSKMFLIEQSKDLVRLQKKQIGILMLYLTSLNVLQKSMARKIIILSSPFTVGYGTKRPVLRPKIHS